jgi:hypothetical protein
MGYNLWLSQDAAYTLGRRLGSGSTERIEGRRVRGERRDDFSEPELNRIEALMDEVAIRLERKRLESPVETSVSSSFAGGDARPTAPSQGDAKQRPNRDSGGTDPLKARESLSRGTTVRQIGI